MNAKVGTFSIMFFTTTSTVVRVVIHEMCRQKREPTQADLRGTIWQFGNRVNLVVDGLIN
jgi:hypothetical protein